MQAAFASSVIGLDTNNRNGWQVVHSGHFVGKDASRLKKSSLLLSLICDSAYPLHSGPSATQIFKCSTNLTMGEMWSEALWKA